MITYFLECVKKTKVLFFLLLYLQVYLPISVFAENIEETTNSYIISEIVVNSEKTNVRVAERELVSKAKIAAFSYIKMYLKIDDLLPNDVEVEALMTEFVPKRMEKNNEGFKGYFYVVFDKAAMESMVVSNKVKTSLKKKKENLLFFRVCLDRDINLWRDFKSGMIAADVDYFCVFIDKDFVEVGVVGFDDFTVLSNKLIQKDLYIVKNNDFFYLKRIDPYD